MIPLAQVLRRHWPAYEQQFGPRLLPSHRRAVHAMLACRTAALGGQLFGCECGHRQFVYHSCNHRACPQCGQADASQWLERQRCRLLPLPYWLVTFTVPKQLHRLFRSHQKLFYSLLLRQSAAALLQLGRHHKDLRAQLGLLAVLQTWTRDLRFHPHLHCVVPGGGLSPDGLRWLRPKRPDYFLPQAALACRLRCRLKQILHKNHPALFAQIPPTVWTLNWVVDVQAVGSGQPALKYLSAYVYRTAFSAQRILHDDGQLITFGYRDHQRRSQSASLTPRRFLHRFLQHVLPKGFQRVRYFGWLSPAAKARFQRIQALLDWKTPQPNPPPEPTPPLCPDCKRPMSFIQWLARPKPIDSS